MNSTIILITFSIICLVVLLAIAVTFILWRADKKVSFSLKESLDLAELPIITLYNSKTKVNFLVDTGSNLSYIDNSILTELEHIITPSAKNISGLGGSSSNGIGALIDFYYKNHKFSGCFYTLPLENTFKAVKEESGCTIHGILGNDFFLKYNSIINFETQTIICTQ